MSLTVLDHPLALDLLSRLRDAGTDPAEFRALTRRLGWLLVIEATRDLATESVAIDTPMEPMETRRISERLVAIPVLRAGLGLLDAVTDLYPDTVVGYLGLERDEVTLQPRDYYAKLPPMDGRRALVVDPMLATGGSGSAAITHVQAQREPHVDHASSAWWRRPRGSPCWSASIPTCRSSPGALDRQLNEVGFILPGLGDFGDRLHGTF